MLQTQKNKATWRCVLNCVVQQIRYSLSWFHSVSPKPGSGLRHVNYQLVSPGLKRSGTAFQRHMTPPITRRHFLRHSALGAAVAASPVLASAGRPDDEAYWASVASHYTVSPDFLNLKNACYGIMAKPVLDDFKRNIDYLNLENSRYLRQEFDRGRTEAIRAQLAQ